MHELSIACHVVEIAERSAREAGAGVINAIEVEIGRLAGVELESLTFCFEAARRDTLAAGAELVIHDLPGRGRCRGCGAETELEFIVAACAVCGAGLEIVQGRELRVRSLNVD